MVGICSRSADVCVDLGITANIGAGGNLVAAIGVQRPLPAYLSGAVEALSQHPEIVHF